MHLLRQVIVFLALCLPAVAGDLEDALTLATHGAGLADSSQAAALRLLVDAGRARVDGEASTWAFLDVWLATEWELATDVPARRAAFARDWPHSRYQDRADYLLARWHLRQGAPGEALPLLLDVQWRAEDATLRGQARALMVEHCPAEAGKVLADTAQVAHAGRAQVLGAMRAAARLGRRLDVVAPLSGDKSAQGRELLAGVEAALAHRKARGEPWTLSTRDIQGDPFLARDLVRKARDEGADAVVISWEQESLSAMGGLELGIPVLVPGHGGPPLHEFSPDLLQLDLDPGAQGAMMATFARDSLRAGSVGLLAPATQPSRRLMRAVLAELGRAGVVESGQEQWYFPGARDLSAQAENLALLSSAFQGPGVWLLLGQEGEAEALRRVLEQVPPGVMVVGDGALLSILGNKAPAQLAGRLFIVSAWLPPVWARAAGLTPSLDGALPPGDAPSMLQIRTFESTRLLLAAAEEGAKKGLGTLAALQHLALPSIFGPSLAVSHGRAAGAWLLAWNGHEFTLLGGRLAAER